MRAATGQLRCWTECSRLVLKSRRSSYCECGCELAGKLGSLKSLSRSPSSISLSALSLRITLDGSSPMVCQCRRRCDCSPPRLIFPFDLHNPPDHASDFTTTDCASQAQRNLPGDGFASPFFQPLARFTVHLLRRVWLEGTHSNGVAKAARRLLLEPRLPLSPSDEQSRENS